MHFVFMGVSGSGKSTVAGQVAERLGLPFAEADSFHPEANIAKMSQGVPLTDADRGPWLTTLAEWIREHERRGEATVMACSALRRAYRDILRTGAPSVYFLHLDAPTEVIAARMRARTGHFMPAGLLASQAATLEPLEPDEPGMRIDIAPPAEDVTDAAVRAVTARLRG
ncbi:gluconokinase [Marinitenerispora sediminis]|uniref:Gluconokinase n=1 Tax=Marinitenerispora sediminis TaxID=1931232 RepID=A0A368T037_9ACTN|nr:gluconokinase [Marinitenerispora sediminis]RCV49561.1 gluconate kinase [Marinitenerispora sediminis]RCV50455.1 gluconate kinase [Marinitenerispora sediminis]RCV52148.1 gluconate kinase [Marinitenerispora sediminis]